MSFARKPAKPAKVIDYTPTPRTPVRGSGLVAAALAGGLVQRKPEPKTADRKSQAIRDSARGEECLIRIPGCPSDPAMTIASHAPLKAAGKGMGIKAVDLAVAYGCTYCDAVVDGQMPLPAGYTREMALLDWMFGHLRTLVRLKQKGLA